MKIKLIKVHINYSEQYSQDYSSIETHIAGEYTDFTEVDSLESGRIHNFVTEYNAKMKEQNKDKGSGEYLMIVHYQEPLHVKTLLADLLAKEEKVKQDYENKVKADREKRERQLKETAEEKAVKKKERLQKQLEKLKAELGQK